jgi:pyruvate,orthophosphate dikinase
MSEKYVYNFGNGQAEGHAGMKNLLGGKGANLAEMNLLGIPVPAGFTITTEVCTMYNRVGADAAKKIVWEQILESVRKMEDSMDAKLMPSISDFPLLLSVRSGARVSMPGMMNTVLNLGLNDATVDMLAKRSDNPRFAWDAYRRFVQMYSNVVMGVEAEGKHGIDPFEERIDILKMAKDYESDTDFTVEDLQELVNRFKLITYKRTHDNFPDDPYEQLWGAICAVFDSWNTPRAIYYRKINRIPNDWGTAVNVQAMVYGNMGADSATGVAFTRDAATGENRFNGEFLINAQGEDVVAGVRTPQQITIVGAQRWAKLQDVSEDVRKEKFPSLEEYMPEAYQQLFDTQNRLERHFHDMQDLEFTIQRGKLWLLQTRNGKRTGKAMVKIAMDMLHEGLVNEKEAILRQPAVKLDELLHPIFEEESLKHAKVIAKGLPASPGAATGRVVFHADDVEQWTARGLPVILVRLETSPEDLKGMDLARGILTTRGGMTSHAAVVARGMGKCCVSGAGKIKVNYKLHNFQVDDVTVKEGDWISLNGTTGEVFLGKIATITPDLTGDFGELMKLTDKYAKVAVRTNADTPEDARVARKFGAKGIGLCRTEHMFFKDNRIEAMREMILAKDEVGRRIALDKLLPMQRSDFEGIFEAMQGMGVTIRLLDPPLHEFVPHQQATIGAMAERLNVSIAEIKHKISQLEEFNPMLGHRGCRLGNTYPEISEMQARAIMEAALNLKAKGIVAKPEIMVPLVGVVEEFKSQKDIIERTIQAVFKERNDSIEYSIGTMIEVPRSVVVADKIAEQADFFSFGTNDLTQMTYGYSRDDAGKFIPDYLKMGILKHDPFEVLDQEGVGSLMRMGVEKGRSQKHNLKVGICGEHGGEPSSVEFCCKLGLDYVSCSPYRVPIARLAVAQAALKES